VDQVALFPEKAKHFFFRENQHECLKMMKRIASWEAYEGQWGELKVCKHGEIATGFEVR